MQSVSNPYRNNFTSSLTYGKSGLNARSNYLNELSGLGNSYTAEFWQYDPRLGRRWNVDPVVKEWESPYATFSGNPIWFVDPKGDNATKYQDEEGNVLADTKDGSDDVITIPNARVDEFKENVAHTPQNMQNSQGWNAYWKTESLGFETTEDMEGYLGNTSSQWSRQKLIEYRQNPTQGNWAKWLAAEVLSQNANPINHLPTPINVKTKTPTPTVSPKTTPTIKVETNVPPARGTNSWVEFNREMGAGKFTKEKYGSSEAAAKARKEAYQQWKKENGY